MDILLSSQVLELLDRKYTFVAESSIKTFMLDLQQFVEFISQNQFISDFTDKIRIDFERKYELYQEKLAEEVAQLIQIKNALVARVPQLYENRQESMQEQMDTSDYLFSFAHFDEIVNRPYHTKFHPDDWIRMDDNSKAAELIKILNFNPDSDAQSKANLQDVEKEHYYTHRNWINICRASAGHDLVFLIKIVQHINLLPKPEPDQMEAWIDAYNERRLYSWVTDLTYGVISNHSTDKPNKLNDQQLESRVNSLKENLKRVYEALRQEIGTTQLYLQLLNRYKIRSQWYNQSYLRNLVRKSNGEYVREREDLLSKDLALFLFDKGITPLYRIKFGAHEVDLLQIDSPDPIFVEAKVYKDNRARNELIDGIAQLHSYLCGIEGYKYIREAYYVMYRLGGPIYEFPVKIVTNRFIIYPIHIDLGLRNYLKRDKA